MLLVALKEHFYKYLSSDPSHDTILWFDPERDYRELLDPLRQAGVPLRMVEHEGELIRVRSELQFRKPGTRTVVYLPWRRDDPASDWLAPILALADVFSDSLFRFLSGLGVEFPQEPKVRNAIRDVLPRLAGQSLGKGAGYWLHVLSSLDAVREELLGDFGDTLLRFLALPNETRQELRGKDIETFFLGLLATRYGFEPKSHEEPPAIARRLTAHLIAVRAFVTSGKPDNFPFHELLPQPHLFDACEAFLRRWEDSSYKVAFIRLADQIEPRYRLDEWLSGLALDTALGLGATFRGIESALWNHVESELTGLASDAAWLAFMQRHRQAFRQRAGAFWAREDKAGQWRIARQAADLLSDVQACLDSLDAIPTTEALIEHYAAPTGWWKVDRAYREFREAIGDATGSYDRLRQRCGRAYHRFLERLNGRFVELLSGRDRWAWKLPEQTAAWNEMVKVQPGKRVAVIFVDALRLELAQALADRLRRDMDAGDIALYTRIVTLPAITPVCMPALLPDGHARKIDYTDDWQVTIGNSGNLALKPEREAYLRAKYPRVQIHGEISTLLDLPADQIPASADLYITFHTALDKIGETAQELALTTFSEIIKQVERAIRKLREIGVQDIIVLTDHGFLLLDDVSEADKAPIKDVPALKSGSRYLVGRGLGYTDQLRFPVPGSRDLEGWFPRGIGCFRTPGKYNYAHGGLSLQEIVTPCLIVTQKVAGGVVAVEMSAPAEIRGRLLKVKLQPVASQVFDRERMVKLLLMKGDKRIIAIDQVIEPAGETQVKVLLPDDAPLEIGDRVTWRLLDAVTGQIIADQPAVNQVDFF